MGNQKSNPFMNYFKIEKVAIFEQPIIKGVKPDKRRLRQSGQRLSFLPHINHETFEAARKSDLKLNMENFVNSMNRGNMIINNEVMQKHKGSLNDNRKIAPTDKYPFCCVGLLQVEFQNKRIRGTAFLIGPNSLLTCAHNLFCRESGLSATKVTFTLDLQQREEVVREGGKEVRQRISAGDQYEVLTWRVPEQYMNLQNQDYPLFDFALLKLKTLSDLQHRYGYFGLDSTWQSRASSFPKVIVSGFPCVTKQNPLNCRLLVEGSGEWTQVVSDAFDPANQQLMEVGYNAYTSPGQSGSPVFYESKGEYYMIGVHTSGGDEENRGVLITSRVREIVNGWIQEMKTIFDISNVEIGDKKINNLVEALRQGSQKITELYLSNNNLGPEEIALIMGMKWSSLKIMILGNNTLKLEGAKSLANPINGWASLEILNINNTMIGDEGCSLLLQKREWKKLRELHLRECNIGKSTLSELTSKNWISLEFINLTLNNLSSDSIKALFENSQNSKRFCSLRFLNLSRNMIGNEGVKIITDYNFRLETLNISKIGMNHVGMEILGGKCWSALTKLYISDNKQVGKAGIIHLTPKSFPLLASAGLEGINLGPQGIKQMMIHEWRHLKSLSLGYNFLRDQGLNELRNSKSLEVLVLQGNNITTVGVIEFARKEEWKGLLQLKLGSNQIKKEGYIQIIQRLTNLYYIYVNSGLNAHEKRELKELALKRNPNLSLDIDRGQEANFN